MSTQSDKNTARTVVIALVALTAALGGAVVTLVLTRASSAEAAAPQAATAVTSTMAPASAPDTVPAPTTVPASTTTAPAPLQPTPVPAPLQPTPVPAPMTPVVVPPAPAPAPAPSAAEALANLSRARGADGVTEIVKKKAGTFAMLQVSGSAQLVKWTGTTWVDERVITDFPVMDILTSDVTGDGTPDFIVRFDNYRMFGGVFNYTAAGWEWLTFDEFGEPTTLVDGIHLDSPGVLGSRYLEGGSGTMWWMWNSELARFQPAGG